MDKMQPLIAIFDREGFYFGEILLTERRLHLIDSSFDEIHRGTFAKGFSFRGVVGHSYKVLLRDDHLGFFDDNLFPLAYECVENFAFRPPNKKSLVIYYKALSVFLGDCDTVR